MAEPDHDVSAGLLSLVDVSAGYGGPPVIADVSITVGRGEIVAIIGPNGAGKSTLVKALLGELKLSAGRITLAGEDITHLSSERRARRGVGYVPQRNDVFDSLTVAENLAMGGYHLGRSQTERRIAELTTAYFPALASLLGRTAKKLSGGERKMLAIARALMAEPQVLVLDEPTASLSQDLSRTLLTKHVRALAAAGTGILLVEQRVAAALEVADRGCLLVSGTLRLTGTGAELATRKDMAELFLGRTSEEPLQAGRVESRS